MRGMRKFRSLFIQRWDTATLQPQYDQRWQAFLANPYGEWKHYPLIMDTRRRKLKGQIVLIQSHPADAIVVANYCRRHGGRYCEFATAEEEWLREQEEYRKAYNKGRSHPQYLRDYLRPHPRVSSVRQ
jgi:hypothetical protein